MRTMKGIVIILAFLGLASADLDLERSITRIQDQIKVTQEKPAVWARLPDIIEAAMPCLINGIEIYKVEAGHLPAALKHYIESITPTSFAQELLKVNWAEVSAKRSNIEPTGELIDDLYEFMNTTEFKTIHDHVWGNEEFLDLVKYIHDANYPNIYAAIRKFYTDNKRDDLAADVPSVATTTPVRLIQTARNVANAPKATSNNFPIITKQSPIFKLDDPKCDLTYLLGLIQKLNEANIQEVIKIFLYALQEFIGNAAMHVLMMKVGESYKGEFFDTTLALPAMEQFLPLVNRAILAEPGFAQVNEILRQLTGLDLANLELFKYIISLLRYLLWNHPFPEA